MTSNKAHYLLHFFLYHTKSKKSAINLMINSV